MVKLISIPISELEITLFLSTSRIVHVNTRMDNSKSNIATPMKKDCSVVNTICNVEAEKMFEDSKSKFQSNSHVEDCVTQFLMTFF